MSTTPTAHELLRKEAYVSLCHALRLPEIFISAREWGKVVYMRLASIAMKNYKDLSSSTTMLASTNALPTSSPASGSARCCAMCDVSGSMWGEPMDVCVALGLLLSELCDEPWRHRVITFSNRPQLHHI
ncbi:hypothetical protein QYE76_037131 [Lolium multiflorum]|uniref:Uncharacterized protein n=1 Tax=Lolium multiflorum TaxID=4521 RepID=A0AAD8VQW6_LOLMU|nr:hypothetical protein QYE76_037131 [Lolium multiflorum]